MQGLRKSCDAAIKRGLARAGGATVGWKERPKQTDNSINDKLDSFTTLTRTPLSTRISYVY
jgi:hypothetical protein